MPIPNEMKGMFMIAVDLCGKLTGYGFVVAERERQKTEEGWTPEHDEAHRNGELEDAALCYFKCATEPGFAIQVLTGESSPKWPWDWSWFKPFNRSRRGYFPAVHKKWCLIRAGALALAEADRMRRAELTGDANYYRVDRLLWSIVAELDGLIASEVDSDGAALTSWMIGLPIR